MELSVSTVREITQQHAARLLEQQKQLLKQIGPEAGFQQMVSQIDGSMVPLVESQEKAKDKRKHKSLFWVKRDCH